MTKTRLIIKNRKNKFYDVLIKNYIIKDKKYFKLEGIFKIATFPTRSRAIKFCENYEVK